MIIVLGCIMFVCRVFSQSSNKYFAPIVQPSPTAASLGKFGDLPIDLSTGAATAEIPLYEFNLKNGVDIAMGLNYSSNGVLVDATSGILGTDWSFTGEFCIRRSVFDDPDEISEDLTKGLEKGFDAKVLSRLIFFGSTPRMDAQPDLFTLVAPGFTGYFFLSGDTAVFLNQNTSYKVKKVSSGFRAVDGKGNVYMFGGDAIETSRKIDNCPSDGYHPDAIFAPTAWFLKSITTPGQETVSYIYSPEYSYNYYSASEITDVVTQRTLFHDGPPCDCPVRDKVICTNMATTNTFRLQEIRTSDKIKISFGYDNKLENSSDYLMKEMSVEGIKDNGTTLLRKIRMQYTNGTKKYRPYLSRVTIFSGSMQDSMVYRMDYNNIDRLPERGDTQTDAWGYYNASGTGSPYPDPSVAHFGTLARITYPTGGYTNFTYEGNTIASYVNQVSYTNVGNLHGYGTGDHSAQKYSTTKTLDRSGSTQLRISGYCAWNFSGAPDYPMHRMDVEVRNAVTDKLIHSQSVYPGETLSYSIIDIGDIFSAGPTGSVKINMTCYGEYLYGEFNAEQVTTTQVLQNVSHGGVRVAKEEDVDADSKTHVKKYAYNRFGRDESSGNYLGYLNFEEELYTENHCPDIHVGGFSHCYAKLRHNKSLMQLFAYSSAPVYYSNVTETFGDNSENGCIRHEFDVRLPIPAVGYQTAATATGHTSTSFSLAPFTIVREQAALETKTEYYKIVDSTLKLVKSEEYEYHLSGPVSKSRTGYAYRTMIMGGDDPNSVSYFTSYDVISYSFYAGWVGLKTKTETLYNETGAPVINTTTDYYNARPVNNNITSSVLTSSRGEAVVTNYKYASDYTGLVYDSMYARNMLDAVIESSKQRSGQQVEKILTEYGFPNGIAGLIASSRISIQNGGGPLEPRYTFNKYDVMGNVLERNMAGNINEVYLWGYGNQLPVAKVIGSDYNTVKALVNDAILQNPVGDAQLRNELDLLRQKLPSGTSVNTYTYNPWSGITSETDPAGKTTFYEYDSFGRLSVIKDQDGKILKHYEYQYQVPVTK
ncbi:MAG TPA: RHS repeat domain-containing protein [Chitinophaga sp.]|uniref:RHS repeat domain-containing protein n=1 Tax=Chitinophaga sp. TaxID=1869181 RepID=UPI002B9736E0|nr:RHS repeat domain-containing protein [Chitinophaga sp.]HVI44392.1 RHS repeat domain-containing protein [Chitinophaga sp.]